MCSKSSPVILIAFLGLPLLGFALLRLACVRGGGGGAIDAGGGLPALGSLRRNFFFGCLAFPLAAYIDIQINK